MGLHGQPAAIIRNQITTNAVSVGTGLSLSGGVLSSTASGTVTSVGVAAGRGFTVSGTPVTTSGTITITPTNIPGTNLFILFSGGFVTDTTNADGSRTITITSSGISTNSGSGTNNILSGLKLGSDMNANLKAITNVAVLKTDSAYDNTGNQILWLTANKLGIFNNSPAITGGVDIGGQVVIRNTLNPMSIDKVGTDPIQWGSGVDDGGTPGNPVTPAGYLHFFNSSGQDSYVPYFQ